MTFLDNAILGEEVLAKSPAGNDFHVAFGVDAQYFRPMGITILSLVKNNPGINFVFHVFYGSVTVDDRDKLKQLVEEYCTTVILYQIDQNIFKDLPTATYITNATYNRLVAVNRLKGIADKVLYLDADIVCIGDMSAMQTINLDGNIAATIKEDDQNIAKHIKKLNINLNGYFNAGVMYIDINQWHNHGVSEKAYAAIVANYEKFTFLDQDALNVVLNNKVLYIDEKWNCLFELDRETIPADTVLLHYAGRTKPWAEWCLNPLRDYFLEYYRQSPWKDIAFDKPTHYKHMKTVARIHKKNGDLLKSAYWYFKYIQTRFRQKR